MTAAAAVVVQLDEYRRRMTSEGYVMDADGHGWLMVRWDRSDSIYPPLPQYLRVTLLHEQGGREYFRVEEGRNAGRMASVRRSPRGTSFLERGALTYGGPASVSYNLTTGELTYGLHSVRATAPAHNPPRLGLFELEIPYEVHRLAGRYLPMSPYATTWFRIGAEGDRYLHPGAESASGVAVDQLDAWTDIYSYLIKSRKGDGRSVGQIRITR